MVATVPAPNWLSSGSVEAHCRSAAGNVVDVSDVVVGDTGEYPATSLGWMPTVAGEGAANAIGAVERPREKADAHEGDEPRGYSTLLASAAPHPVPSLGVTLPPPARGTRQDKYDATCYPPKGCRSKPLARAR